MHQPNTIQFINVDPVVTRLTSVILDHEGSTYFLLMTTPSCMHTSIGSYLHRRFFAAQEFDVTVADIPRQDTSLTAPAP